MPLSLPPLRRMLPASVMLLLLVTLLSVLTPAPARAATDGVAETRFVDSVNAERAQRGLDRLVVKNDLRTVARRHSVRMADRSHLHHNPRLGSDVKSWRRVAENVGRGPSVSSLHRALMNSSGHRANILDSRVTEIGVGVEVRGSTVWVTQVFRLPNSTTTVSFSDVSSRATHSNEIRRVAAAGISMGCSGSRYCPSRQVSRAEMATFLARSRGLVPADGSSFGDARRTPVHAANIQAIRNAGITTGCTSGQFCPTRNVSRAEMASFLARARGLSPKSGSRFSDVSARSTHAGAINALADAGVTSGCGGGRYCPHRAVTRAEMATFLVRAFRL